MDITHSSMVCTLTEGALYMKSTMFYLICAITLVCITYITVTVSSSVSLYKDVSFSLKIYKLHVEYGRWDLQL